MEQELEHSNSGLEEMLSRESERRNEAERRLKAESTKRYAGRLLTLHHECPFMVVYPSLMS